MKSMDGDKIGKPQRIALVVILVALGTTGIVSSLLNAGGNLARYKSVKKQIDEGKYSYSAPGVILLSSSDRSVSADGFVYTTGDPPTIMLFPRWRGEGASVVATGWSSTEMKVGSEIDARIPKALDSADTNRASAVPPTEIEKIHVVQDLREGWYLFERRSE